MALYFKAPRLPRASGVCCCLDSKLKLRSDSSLPSYAQPSPATPLNMSAPILGSRMSGPDRGTGTADQPYSFVYARVFPCLRGDALCAPFLLLTLSQPRFPPPTPALTRSPSPEPICCVVTAFLSGRAPDLTHTQPHRPFFPHLFPTPSRPVPPVHLTCNFASYLILLSPVLVTHSNLLPLPTTSRSVS